MGPRAGAACWRATPRGAVGWPRRDVHLFKLSHRELAQAPEAIPRVLADGRGPTRHSSSDGDTTSVAAREVAESSWPAWAPAEAHGRAPGLHKAEQHEVCETRIFSCFWNRAVIVTLNQNESHTKKGGNIDDTTNPSGTDRHGQTDSPQSCARKSRPGHGGLSDTVKPTTDRPIAAKHRERHREAPWVCLAATPGSRGAVPGGSPRPPAPPSSPYFLHRDSRTHGGGAEICLQGGGTTRCTCT